jgi:hypothetical protein
MTECPNRCQNAHQVVKTQKIETFDKGRVGHREEWSTGIRVKWTAEVTKCDGCSLVYATEEQREHNVKTFKLAKAKAPYE